jgi:hypothetical protein
MTRSNATAPVVRVAAHDAGVPRISFFYGIAITMYLYDHDPPHFHAQYAEHHAVIAIASGEMLVGALPSRALKLVTEWADLHREELEADWERASKAAPPTRSTHCPKIGLRWSTSA